ncbi:kinase-like domain-containing protein, partial [Halenospora varia]
MSQFHANCDPNYPSRLPFRHPSKLSPTECSHKCVSNLLATGSWDCLIKESELGRGGFGVVHKVRCRATNETYARKVVSSPPSPSSAVSSEANILRNLKHSHIIKLVASGKSGHFGWLLMSPVAKSDLAIYLHQVGSKPRKLSLINTPKRPPLHDWIGCLSSALAYLHKNGVVHGDVKPKNILISSEQVVYMADFGTAKYAKESKMTARIFSAITPMYCAPEIAHRQSPSLDYPADVFSLGCVWAEM